MMDLDGENTFDIVTTANGVRFGCRTLAQSNVPMDLRNAADDFLLILPLQNGRVRVEGGQGYVFDGAVQTGMMRFVQPGERVSITVKAGFERAILFIPGPVFREHVKPASLSIEDGIVPGMAPLSRPSAAVQRLVPLFGMARTMSMARRQILLQGLTATLVALLLDPEIHRLETPIAGFDQTQFDQVLRFAKARLNQPLSVADWAGAVGLSPSEFTRRFQKHTGDAPYSWLLDRRIDLAKRLLAQDGRSLVDVALASGFCSQSHFTEAFRRRVGASPGRWRKFNQL